MISEKVTIAVLGNFQNGKSTLINCIIESDIAKVGGMGVSVTHTNIRYTYGDSDKVTIVDHYGKKRMVPLMDYIAKQDEISAKEIIIKTNCSNLKYFDIIDTPGSNANEHETSIAIETLEEINFAILLLRNKDISKEEKKIAIQLAINNIPFICIINCFDEIFDNWNPKTEQNERIMRTVLAELETNGCYPVSKLKIKPVYVVNLMWYWLSLCKHSKNKTIALCDRQIHSFWDDYIGTSGFSATMLKRASSVEPLLKLFCNKFLAQYLTSFKYFKLAHKDCLDITIGDVETERKYIISSICSDISNSIDKDIESVRRDIESLQKRKKENENLSIFNLSGIIRIAINILLSPRSELELRSRMEFLNFKKERLISFVKSI